ncbi:MAG: FixH family protein [Spirochaetota bacterium]|nr:FixH family protein [Spirochaetota bacterium]
MKFKKLVLISFATLMILSFTSLIYAKKVVEPTPHEEDGITITLYNSTGVFTKGNNDFELEFKKDGKMLDVGNDVTVKFYMPPMPPSMPEMWGKGDSKLSKTSTSGLYKGSVSLPMGHTWQVIVKYTIDGKSRTLTFDIEAEE